MTKVQSIIKEIKSLSMADLEPILEEILSRMNQEQHIQAAMHGFVGIGKGVWENDAQDYVTSLRDDNRF